MSTHHASSISLILVLSISSLRADAQTWTPTSAPAANWQSVASSADGQMMFAAINGGLIYSSFDGGMNWKSTGAPSNLWNCVVSSADGSRLLAAAEGSPLLMSTNSGITWTHSCSQLTNWLSVACSGDAKKLAALGAVNLIPPVTCVYCSTDGGATWMPTPYSSAETAISASADGSCLAEISYGVWPYGVGPVCTSSNWGASWECPTPDAKWTSIAISADGSKVLAASDAVWALGNPAFLFGSKDNGASWTAHSPPGYYIPEITVNPTLLWLSLGGSADGSTIAGAAFEGGIYTSSDFGVTWVTNNAPSTNWECIACSADGQKMVAGVWGGLIYTSQRSPQPHLTIALSPTNSILSWTVPSSDFILEQSGTLSPGEWKSAEVKPVLNCTNLQYQVCVPRAEATLFYRLVSK